MNILTIRDYDGKPRGQQQHDMAEFCLRHFLK